MIECDRPSHFLSNEFLCEVSRQDSHQNFEQSEGVSVIGKDTQKGQSLDLHRSMPFISLDFVDIKYKCDEVVDSLSFEVITPSNHPDINQLVPENHN